MTKNDCEVCCIVGDYCVAQRAPRNDNARFAFRNIKERVILYGIATNCFAILAMTMRVLQTLNPSAHFVLEG